MANTTFGPLVQRWRRRRVLESYHKAWLGFGVLLMTSVLVAALLFAKTLGVGYAHYTAQFLQAASLSPGNPITIAGIEVGHVTSVELAGDHVEADLMVRDNISLGKDTRATIKVMTILGSRYLDLAPDGPDSLPHNTIPLAHTEVPYDLQSALQDATTTFEQVDSDKFAQSLAVLGGQLKDVPPLIPAAIANLHALSSIIADRRDQLGGLLKSTQQVADTLRGQQTALGNLIDQAQDLLGEFVAHQATFHALLRALTSLVDNLDRIVVNDRPALDEMLTNLRSLTDMVGKHDDLLRNVLQVAPIPLRNIANATGYGPVVEFGLSNGLAIDSWMCAISGRAKQFGMVEYFKDCK
jgi:virulence factor Mce-like protein